MLGLKKKVEEQYPIPYVNPEEVEDRIDVFKTMKGNFEFDTTDEDAKELLDCIPIAKEKGLSNQVPLLKRRAIAALLEARGMELIVSDESNSSGYEVSRYRPDGVRTWVSPKEKRNTYRSTSLKSFDWGLPVDIIKKIPGELINSAKVLYRTGDPVIYIPLTQDWHGKWWGIAIYHW